MQKKILLTGLISLCSISAANAICTPPTTLKCECAHPIVNSEGKLACGTSYCGDKKCMPNGACCETEKYCVSSEQGTQCCAENQSCDTTKGCVSPCGDGLTPYEGTYYPAMYDFDSYGRDWPTRYSEIDSLVALPTKVSGNHCCSNNPNDADQYGICCSGGQVEVSFYDHTIGFYAYGCSGQDFCDSIYGDGQKMWKMSANSASHWEKLCIPTNYKKYDCGEFDYMGIEGLGMWKDPSSTDSSNSLCTDQS